MAYVNLERILEVVDRLALTRMIAFDGEGHTVDSAEVDSKVQLCEVITALVQNTSGTLRIEAWQAPHPRQPGQRKADAPKVERLSWHVRGLLGSAAQPAAPQPIAGPGAPAPVVAAPSLSADDAVRLARAEWDAQQLRQRIADLEAATDDQDDDQDDDSNTAGPDLSRPLFGMSGDQTFNVLSGLREILAPLVRPGPAQPIGAPPPVTDAERRLMDAFKRFAAAQPAEAQSVVDQLLSNFGADPTPSNGQQAQTTADHEGNG